MKRAIRAFLRVSLAALQLINHIAFRVVLTSWVSRAAVLVLLIALLAHRYVASQPGYHPDPPPTHPLISAEQRAEEVALADPKQHTRPVLNVRVFYDGANFGIVNLGKADLLDVRVEVNRGLFSHGYSIAFSRIRRRKPVVFSDYELQKRNGVRFHRHLDEPRSFYLSCRDVEGNSFSRSLEVEALR